MTNPIATWMVAKRDSWTKGFATRADRRLAWLDMYLFDQGWWREILPNFHRPTPTLERQGHPTPWQLRRAKRRGVQTIINLRADQIKGSTPLSKAVCKDMGLTHIHLPMRSRKAPKREMMLQIVEAFETAATPIMIHCKAGADRTGLIAALYLATQCDVEFDTARQQLSLRFGHFANSATGILGAFLDAYDTQAKPLKQWLSEDYDPAQLTQEFNKHRKSTWTSFWVERVLRRE